MSIKCQKINTLMRKKKNTSRNVLNGIFDVYDKCMIMKKNIYSLFIKKTRKYHYFVPKNEKKLWTIGLIKRLLGLSE